MLIRPRHGCESDEPQVTGTASIGAIQAIEFGECVGMHGLHRPDPRLNWTIRFSEAAVVVCFPQVMSRCGDTVRWHENRRRSQAASRQTTIGARTNSALFPHCNTSAYAAYRPVRCQHPRDARWPRSRRPAPRRSDTSPGAAPGRRRSRNLIPTPFAATGWCTALVRREVRWTGIRAGARRYSL